MYITMFFINIIHIELSSIPFNLFFFVLCLNFSAHFESIINFVRHVRTGSAASFGLISKTMLRTQMDAIHPHCYPFLIVRFFSLQFSNIECLWVGWYRISSVLGIWLWPNQKHKRTQISTGTNGPIPWPHISSLLQPVMEDRKWKFVRQIQYETKIIRLQSSVVLKCIYYIFNFYLTTI